MKKSVACILCIISFSIFAQPTREVDSLLKAIEYEKTDSNLYHIYNQIGQYYENNNSSKAIEYYLKANDICKTLNDPVKQSRTYYSLGYNYLQNGQYDKALEFYQLSATAYEQQKDTRRLANALMSIGNVFFQNKNLEKATEYYDKAEAIVIQRKDTNQLSTIYSERGIIYDQLHQYDTAITLLKKSLALARQAGNEDFVFGALTNIGLSYKHLNQNDIALKYFDSLKTIYKNIRDLPLDYMAILNNNIGATHAQAANFENALLAFQESLNLSLEGGYRTLVLENYRNMADLFASIKDYRQQSIYLTKYHDLKDSIFTSDNKNKLTQLETDYQLEKQHINLVKQRNQRNLFLVLAIASLLLFAGLGFFYRKIRMANKKINKQKEELENLNHVKDRLFSVISHDVRNPLVTLNSYFGLIDNPDIGLEKKEKYRLQTVQAVTQTGIMLDNLLVWANMQLKNTKPTLTNTNIDDCISDAIGAVKAQAQQKNIRFTKKIIIQNCISDYHLLEIVLRNILTNAVKYSHQDGEVAIESYTNNNNIIISVKDNGIGMNETQLATLQSNEVMSSQGTKGEKGSGLGLFLVKELLQKTNARLTIESVEAIGSKFMIEIPL